MVLSVKIERMTSHSRQTPACPPAPIFSRWIPSLLIGLLTVTLAACLAPNGGASQPTAPTVDISAASTQAVATIFAGASQTAQAALPTATPTPLPSPTLDPNRTPPPLPAAFTTELLNPIDTPHTYLADTCQYLRSKWDPANAAPGTIVIPIMFHGIPDENISDPNEITKPQLKKLIKDLKDQGFEAISASQLADFLEFNTKIPPRSFVMILDDRRPGTAYGIFQPILEDNNWKMTLAWPIGYGDDTTDKKPATNVAGDPQAGTYPNLWAQIEHYYSSGYFEVESHGYFHNIPMDDNSSDEYLHQELDLSMQTLQEHFGRKPVAIIWPGGGFGKKTVQFARAAGYRIGFTINPRGPVMFNWVPQADQSDPQRPVYLPEGPAGDPLLTLPRYWPSQLSAELDKIRNIGSQAAAHAEMARADEIEYYDIVCAPKYGPMPVVGP